MPPAFLVVVTFGIWILARGEASKYAALATTPNPNRATPASAPSTSGSASTTQGTPAAPGQGVLGTSSSNPFQYLIDGLADIPKLVGG